MTCRTVDTHTTVEVSRPGSGLGNLTIDPDCPDGGGIWWNDLALPDNALRYTYAPTSAWVPGTVLLAATQDASSLALRLAARGASLAALETHKRTIEALFAQWSYRITVTTVDREDVDGEPVVLGAWDALPAAVSWGAVRPTLQDLLTVETTLVVPVNPAGAP